MITEQECQRLRHSIPTLKAIKQAKEAAWKVHALCVAMQDTTDTERLEFLDLTRDRISSLCLVMRRECDDLLKEIKLAEEIEQEREREREIERQKQQNIQPRFKPLPEQENQNNHSFLKPLE